MPAPTLRESDLLPRTPVAVSRPWMWVLGLALLALVGAAAVASWGGPQGPAEAVVTLLGRCRPSVMCAVLYLWAAAGMGRLWSPLLRPVAEAAAVRFALGLGTLLAVSHALGMSGVLGGEGNKAGRFIAVGVLLVPAMVDAWMMAKERQGRRLTVEGLIAAVPLVVGGALVALACNPPGWLWASEFGAFDALSYHLALPQEWLVNGRLAPTSANVYSFLPSYFEAAFMHVGAACADGAVGLAGEEWLTARDGRGALACQLLHGGTMLAAVWIVGRFAASAMGEAVSVRRKSVVVGVVRLVVLLTPWSVVVGTLAYNEWPMIALGCAALMVAGDATLSASRRGVLVAFLIGSACGVKPTAAQFFAPSAVLLACGSMPARRWHVFVGVGGLVGAATLAPWMVRNGMATGNPLFPFAPKVLGFGHWTLEQHERFHAAHRFEGSWMERIRLLVLPDANDPAGVRHRGLMHPQWGALLALGAVASAMTCFGAFRKHWRWGAVFGVMLLAWMLTTHLQSRFLLPLVVPCVGVLAAAGMRMRTGVGAVLAGVVVATQVVAMATIVAAEHGGQPNRLLLPGPGLFTGEVFANELAEKAPDEVRAWMGEAPPELFLNLDPSVRTNGERARVLLIGDSTPLYFANAGATTVWDRSPLVAAMAEAPGAPAAWTESLKRDGFGFALVNYAELQRFELSGYGDPRLSAEAVAAWAAAATMPVRAWQGRVLVRLLVPPQDRPGVIE